MIETRERGFVGRFVMLACSQRLPKGTSTHAEHSGAVQLAEASPAGVVISTDWTQGPVANLTAR